MRVMLYVRGIDSLGPAYVMSSVKSRGHEVELLFDPGLDNNFYYHLPLLEFANRWDRLIRHAVDWRPDLVGFSVPTNVFPYALEFARRLRRRLRVPTIFGGIHPTALPEYVLRHDEVDYVCRGEGELTMAELADCLERGRSPEGIPSLGYKRDGAVHLNPLRPLVEDLDTLPFPHRDAYFREGAFRTLLHVVTGRGCPFRCSYCVNSFLWGQLYRKQPARVPAVRHRSPGNVIREIRDCAARYPIDLVYFCDECFGVNRRRLFAFLEQYQHEVALPFSFSYHHRAIDEEVARRLADAGAVYAQGAIETADPELRRNVLGRNDTDDEIVRAMRILKAHGIRVSTSAIFGIPRETEESRWATVRLVEESRPDMVNSYLLYPFPGTRIFDLARREGFLSEEGAERARQGISSYHQESLLQNLDLDRAATMAGLLPVYVKGPRLAKPLVRMLMRRRVPRLAHLAYLASAPLLYSGWTRRWMADLIRMLRFRLTGRPSRPGHAEGAATAAPTDASRS
jgi:radical SAM superfamily enzyme YgiQ (UPF0313 family)